VIRGGYHLRLRLLLALFAVAVFAAGSSPAGHAAPSAPTLTNAVGDGSGYITATWTPPADISSFSFIAFWTGTSSHCDSQGPGQGCMIFDDNGNENVDVTATTHKSLGTYEPGTTEWVQVCYFAGGIGYYCSNAVSVTMPAASTAANGSTGGTTGTTTTTPASVKVTLSNTATIVHSDGTKETVAGGKSAGVVVGDALRAGAKAARVAVREGRLVIAPGTDLHAVGEGIWDVQASPSSKVGEAWFNGTRYLVVDVGTWQVSAVTNATFVVSNLGHRDEIQALTGKVDVQPAPIDTSSSRGRLVLLPGFETFTINTAYFHAPTTPAKFKPPANAFWK